MQQSSYHAMPMPTPQFSPQQQGPNYTRFNGIDSRRQPNVVVSKLSTILEHADRSELQELHDSEEKLHKLLDENDEIKQLQVEREMQLAGNRSLAEYNMKLGPKLSNCKQRLGELYKQLNDQTRQFHKNKRNLESLSGQYNPDTLMALLQTSVAQSEEASEKIADRFMDGDITVDDFLEQHLKERTTVHLRRTKVDKLREIMRRR